MSQHLTERFNEFLSKQRSKMTTPRIRVYHERDPDTRAYKGHTVCTLSYLDKTKGPSTIIGTAVVSPNEKRPMTKKDGYRIATERAYKQFLRIIK